MNYWHVANCTFEVVQAILVWVSVFRLTDERQVKGFYAPTFVFSALWALECLPYYVSNHDYWSAVPCAVRALGLVFWSLLYLYFKRANASSPNNLRVLRNRTVKRVK